MTRDMSWRPVQRARKAGLPGRAFLVATLLAVNAAVILYHGDPRDRLPEPASGAAPTVAARPGSKSRGEDRAGGRGSSPSTVQAAARTTPTLPGLAARIEPLAGMRQPGSVQRVEVIELGHNETPAKSLLGAGLAAADVQAALAALDPVVDFRRMRPGDRFKARLDADGRLLSLDVRRGISDQARAHRIDAGQDESEWRSERLQVPVDTVTTRISGQVHTSLWDAVVEAGESPTLVDGIVDAFAWEIDFYSEVHPGDSFRVLVDKRYAEGELLGYGDLLAAEFVSQGQRHRGFLHRRADGSAAYYDEEGRSLQRQLLRSPLKYGHVTSNYGMRRHPILGYNRQHNGVDYGVPLGTPAWSVGEGRVVHAGWLGGYGKLVMVRHGNGWVSEYAHLSKILVRQGQRISQKQMVGLVGSTGVSTGPHLHFGLKHHGRHVNPAAQRFGRGQALTGVELKRYRARVAELAADLEAIQAARQAAGLSSQEG